MIVLNSLKQHPSLRVCITYFRLLRIMCTYDKPRMKFSYAQDFYSFCKPVISRSHTCFSTKVKTLPTNSPQSSSMIAVQPIAVELSFENFWELWCHWLSNFWQLQIATIIPCNHNSLPMRCFMCTEWMVMASCMWVDLLRLSSLQFIRYCMNS